MIVPTETLAAIEGQVNQAFEALTLAATALQPEPPASATCLGALYAIYGALSRIHEAVKIIAEENGHGS